MIASFLFCHMEEKTKGSPRIDCLCPGTYMKHNIGHKISLSSQSRRVFSQYLILFLCIYRNIYFFSANVNFCFANGHVIAAAAATY